MLTISPVQDSYLYSNIYKHIYIGFGDEQITTQTPGTEDYFGNCCQ